MTLWTLAQIKTKIQDDLDLTDQVMITGSELTANINAAVDEAEQLVHTIYEDYLLQHQNLALTSGVSEYDLPSNIYAHKIRRIFYDNGSDRYLVRRIRDLSEIPDIQTNDWYRYLILTNSTGGFKIKLYPTSAETSSTNVDIWFIGGANILSLDADIMNIPEAVRYVIEKAKLLCARKEGHPSQMALEQEVEKQRELLVSTLTAMVPDEDNKLLIDEDLYRGFNGSYRGNY